MQRFGFGQRVLDRELHGRVEPGRTFQDLKGDGRVVVLRHMDEALDTVPLELDANTVEVLLDDRCHLLPNRVEHTQRRLLLVASGGPFDETGEARKVRKDRRAVDPFVVVDAEVLEVDTFGG